MEILEKRRADGVGVGLLIVIDVILIILRNSIEEYRSCTYPQQRWRSTKPLWRVVVAGIEFVLLLLIVAALIRESRRDQVGSGRG